MFISDHILCPAEKNAYVLRYVQKVILWPILKRVDAGSTFASSPFQINCVITYLLGHNTHPET